MVQSTATLFTCHMFALAGGLPADAHVNDKGLRLGMHGDGDECRTSLLCQSQHCATAMHAVVCNIHRVICAWQQRYVCIWVYKSNTSLVLNVRLQA